MTLKRRFGLYLSFGSLVWASPVVALGASSSGESSVNFNLEPIVGYERTQQILPSPVTTNRLIYGARATIGAPLISGEFEYTRGQNQTVSSGSTYSYTGDKLKIGVRSGLTVGSVFRFSLRAGVQGSQETTTIESAGTSTVNTSGILYRPYGGAGLRFNLSSKITASAEIVAVIPDVQDMSQNEYQATAGFSIRLP